MFSVICQYSSTWVNQFEMKDTCIYNAPSFSLDLIKVHLPCETPNMECFAKIVNGRTNSSKFVKGSILDILMDSEYV